MFVQENIPVNLSLYMQIKESVHNLFRKPSIVKLFTYLPSFLFSHNKSLAQLILRCHKIFHNNIKFNNQLSSKIYGGDKLSTLEKLHKKLETLPNPHHETKIDFTTSNCLIAACQIRQQVSRRTEGIAILNLANRWQKCGVAFAPYGGSQEEFLARRSNLGNNKNFSDIHHLLSKIRRFEGYSQDEKYVHHLPYFGAAVTSNVTFIADEDPISVPTKFEQFDVISSAAPDMRKGSDESIYLQKHCSDPKKAQEQIITEKLKAVFDAAIFNKDTHLVLGAYGCGCFENDTAAVARIFKQLLDSDYAGRFQNIIFAITDSDKLKIFQQVFSA